MGRPLHVLIVEDSEEDAELLLGDLRRGGFEPVWERVESAETMSAALGRQAWEIVISDHNMPRFDSRRALELARARDSNLPFIIVSGSVGEDFAVAAMKAGASDYFLKGNLKRLSAAVEREVREAESRRAGREAEQKYRTLVEEIPAVTYVADLDDRGATTYISPQIEVITGYPAALWMEDPAFRAKAIHPDDRDRVHAQVRLCRETGEPFLCEYRLVGRSGRIVWCRDNAHVIRDAEGRPKGLRGFLMDVTETKIAAETIRHMAYHDRLTSLPNRTLLEERLDQMLFERPGGRKPFALLLLNLDRFKEVNNTLGRNNGDRLLKEVAGFLRAIVEEAGTVARVGPDEFGILLPGTDAGRASLIAESILKGMEKPLVLDGIPIETEASIGIALCPVHGEESNLLLQRAAVALQAARVSGSGWAVYASASDPYSPRRLQLMGELRRAIESDSLVLQYQPKVDFKSCRMVGAEALLRWRHPKFGLISPVEFLGPAEQSGLIRPLTSWVMNEALRRSRSWLGNGDGAGRSVAVNLSARNLQDPHLAGEVRALLDTWGVQGRHLILEITESTIMADVKRATEVLGDLRRSGVRFSIDDFGTGYSSLSNLRRLPVDELKIDRSFVMGLSASEEDAAIVRLTVDLGHRLKLNVVAEGVEDEKTYRALAEAGCDTAQGYYMARPMDADVFEAWIRESPWGTPSAARAAVLES